MNAIDERKGGNPAVVNVLWVFSSEGGAEAIPQMVPGFVHSRHEERGISRIFTPTPVLLLDLGMFLVGSPKYDTQHRSPTSPASQSQARARCARPEPKFVRSSLRRSLRLLVWTRCALVWTRCVLAWKRNRGKPLYREHWHPISPASSDSEPPKKKRGRRQEEERRQPRPQLGS